jgi:uncharacterized protein YciI
MYVLELAFDDSPARLAARPAHRERLAELYASGILVLAGPWRGDTGAMLILNAAKATVDEIIAADPYYRTPGVRVTSLREWDPLRFSP